MVNTLLQAARALIQLAQYHADGGRGMEALVAFEQGYTAALMQESAVSVRFRIVTPDLLPEVASPEHVLAEIAPGAVQITAQTGILMSTCSDFRRFPVIGRLCSEIARDMVSSRRHRFVIDMGDGNDLGDYDRVAFSSTLPGTALIVDPYFFFF